MTDEPSAVSFPALGSVAVLVAAEAGRLAPARAAVERVAAECDLACSRFRQDSELSAVNAGAGSSVRVGPLLLETVSAALRAAEITDGDVDPTIGQALIALGYDRDFAELNRPQSTAGTPGSSLSIAAVPGWRTVRVDREQSAIRVGRGVSLDLGATAKALAADHAAAQAHLVAGCGVLVSLGGDVAIAGPPPPQGWRVRVTDDHRSGVQAPGQWITLRSGGLATSSTTVRRWQSAHGPAHHLIDPATGGPVDAVWQTVSVCAASCLDANIATTAAIVRGVAAVDWLQSLNLPSRLVGAGGLVRHLAGWPADGDDLAARPASAEPAGQEDCGNPAPTSRAPA